MKVRSRREGFSLIELIIVLVILSVITALVVPRLTQSLSRMNIESTARRVASALRLARSLAVTEKVPYLAEFDMGADMLTVVSYQTSFEEGNSLESEVNQTLAPRVYELTDGVHFKEGVSLDGEALTTGTFQMAFFPAGGSSGGRVVLGDDEERFFSIDVDGITGLVKINERDTTDD
jgi:general secretion pathway protein H